MIGCVCHGLALSFSPSFVERLSTRLRTSCGAHPTVHIFLKEVVQFLRPDGFAEIPIHSRCQASLAITSHRVRGQGDHFLIQAEHLFQTLLHRAFSETDSRTAKVKVGA